MLCAPVSVRVQLELKSLRDFFLVVLTSFTSSYNHKTVKYYQSIFQSFSGHGSALTVILFIQASRQDVEALINYICNKLNMDLDYIMPFTGISENGHKIYGLNDHSELAPQNVIGRRV